MSNGHPAGPHRISRVHRALAHPVRARILAELHKAPASPSELSRTVGATVSATSYHVRILAEAGLAELVRTEHNRGAVQRFYAACTPNEIGVTLSLPLDEATELQRRIRACVDGASSDRDGVGERVDVTVIVHRQLR